MIWLRDRDRSGRILARSIAPIFNQTPSTLRARRAGTTSLLVCHTPARRIHVGQWRHLLCQIIVCLSHEIRICVFKNLNQGLPLEKE